MCCNRDHRNESGDYVVRLQFTLPLRTRWTAFAQCYSVSRKPTPRTVLMVGLGPSA